MPVLFGVFCNNAEIFQLAMNFLPTSSYWVRDEARKSYGECCTKKKKIIPSHYTRGSFSKLLKEATNQSNKSPQTSSGWFYQA